MNQHGYQSYLSDHSRRTSPSRGEHANDSLTSIARPLMSADEVEMQGNWLGKRKGLPTQNYLFRVCVDDSGFFRYKQRSN
jgi:hypothetical protein